MKLLHNILIPLALSGFVACQDYDADHYNQVYSGVDSIYIEMTFDIADGDAFTRAAVPNGGEEGDGWEYGREYENQLHHFTVFVLGGGNGINAAANTQFVGSRYFTDEEVARVDSIREYNLQLKNYDVRKDVLTYTFSIPILSSREEIVPDPYRFIVVANDGDLTSYKTLGALRDALPEKSWTEATGGATTPTHFVMSNENDNYYASGTGVVENPYRLHVTIERLAARIDFSTHYPKSNATYDATTYSKPGYVYKIWKEGDTTEPTSNDRFVVTNVTPFNLTNGANEFFVKRVSEGNNFASRTDVIPIYLGDETTTNWVLDSYSNAAKTAPSYATYFLANNTLDALKTQTAVAASAKKVELSTTWHDNTDNYISKDGYDNIIVGYATENTIDDNSPLYYYATGLAIEGLYIHDNVAAPRVVYTFLRHQGEGYASGQSSYDAFKLVGETDEETTALILAAKDMKCNPGTAMNFGVVRNNIYRVSIDKITEEPNGPKVTLLIKVKKWDKFVHVPIYM